MRTYSVYQIKRKLKGQKVIPLQVKPREGSITRELYDLFTKSPGKIIEVESGTFNHRGGGQVYAQALSQLRLAYGLDIRNIKYGNCKADRKSLWALAGEWFGAIYIDYTAETEEQMDLLAEARYALQHVERVENILPEGVHRLSKESMDILQRIAAKGREIEAKHSKRGA